MDFEFVFNNFYAWYRNSIFRYHRAVDIEYIHAKIKRSSFKITLVYRLLSISAGLTEY